MYVQIDLVCFSAGNELHECVRLLVGCLVFTCHGSISHWQACACVSQKASSSLFHLTSTDTCT